LSYRVKTETGVEWTTHPQKILHDLYYPDGTVHTSIWAIPCT